MSLGPSTVRPSARPAAVVKKIHDRKLTWIGVTHPDGVLVGVVLRGDLEKDD
jgi:hypothetical protein